MRSINNRAVASKAFKWKKESHISHFKSKAYWEEKKKLTEEAMSKAKTGQKLSFLAPNI